MTLISLREDRSHNLLWCWCGENGVYVGSCGEIMGRRVYLKRIWRDCNGEVYDESDVMRYHGLYRQNYLCRNYTRDDFNLA